MTTFRHRYFAALCCTAAGFAQTPQAVLRNGSPAPPIVVDRLLQAPAGARASLADLKGKVVVLEFWGTWCGPCVAAIPHLNSLVSEYQSRPVQFLFLTDEEQWRVEAFLKLRPITGWIGLDPTRATFDAYGAEALPKTVVLDGNGMVAAITGPSGLTEKLIDDTLAGEVAGPAASARPAREEASAPMFEMLVCPAKPAASARVGENQIMARGAKLGDIIGMVYKISRPRIVMAEPIASTTYEVNFLVPPEQKGSLTALASSALENAFRMTLERKTIERDVLILQAPEGAAKLRKSTRDVELPIFGDPGQLTGKSTQLKFFASVLEGHLNRPVLDETGLEGRFDVALYWNAKNPDSAIRAVHDQLGLWLTSARRQIEVLVVKVPGD
jgi:uncharacterized protein (TIGR03435 family)